ncbi:MAG: MFS transporter, partial [Actinobacteria bacterium]|nr:MFS transporter [Actinomycetota bacterium]
DQAAGIKAVSEITGVGATDVATIATLNAQHGPALQAAQAVDPTTQATLVLDKTNTAALQKAVQEITSKLGISAADAEARLQDLTTIPVAQLLLLQSSGNKVVGAQNALLALAKVPAADTAFLQKYASLNEPKVQQILTDVQKAAKDSPKQWQHYFWIAVGGEVVFIPLIFLLVGYWSPKRAREAEREHEAMVERELAKL